MSLQNRRPGREPSSPDAISRCRRPLRKLASRERYEAESSPMSLVDLARDVKSSREGVASRSRDDEILREPPWNQTTRHPIPDAPQGVRHCNPAVSRLLCGQRLYDEQLPASRVSASCDPVSRRRHRDGDRQPHLGARGSAGGRHGGSDQPPSPRGLPGPRDNLARSRPRHTRGDSCRPHRHLPIYGRGGHLRLRDRLLVHQAREGTRRRFDEVSLYYHR